MICLEYIQFYEQLEEKTYWQQSETQDKDNEKKKELLKRFIKIMRELNIENNYFENIKEMNDKDERKFDYICRQYLFLLEKLKQEVGSNELFLFSILTGRINTAKVLWKRGKVRSFKIYLLFLYLIFLQNQILLALVAAKILKRFADVDEDYSEIHNKNAEFVNLSKI